MTNLFIPHRHACMRQVDFVGQEPRTRLTALKLLQDWMELDKGRPGACRGSTLFKIIKVVMGNAVLLRRVGLRLLDKHSAVREEAYLLAMTLKQPQRMELLSPLPDGLCL